MDKIEQEHLTIMFLYKADKLRYEKMI